jgi:hypothetical protein
LSSFTDFGFSTFFDGDLEAGTAFRFIEPQLMDVPREKETRSLRHRDLFVNS